MRGERLENKRPIGLTIGGFDPSSGAGITADLKVFEDSGLYGISAISAITTQNSQAVLDVFTPPPDIFKSQLEVLFNDIHPEVIKVGMLSTRSNVAVLKEQLLRLNKKRLIVDPIFTSTSGMNLLNKEGQQALTDELLPLALVVTPNIDEAQALAGFKINTIEDAQRAASIINDLGPKWVVIKGSHHEFEDGFIHDLIYDGVNFDIIKHKRLSANVRGTGCVFSAAIASYLALGEEELEAIKKAHTYIRDKIKTAATIGKGRAQV